ncbi:MAG: aminopeptidase P family protein [Candidatus Eremiobacteraeota bacterium]|nr:aminopeptidase P family protein [Candidatus Eremiobacteraeota bacterium]
MELRREPAQDDGRKASHDSDTPKALVDFMSGNWLDVPPVTGHVPELERYRERRAALSKEYRGTYVVIPAGGEKVRANDTSFRYRPSSDFAYLLGGGEPGALLVLEPKGAGHESVLFVPAHNRGSAEFFSDRVYGELWVGRHRGVEESKEFFGVDRCRPIADIRVYLDDLRGAGHAAAVVRSNDDVIDALLPNSSRDGELATQLSEMRLIKDEFEISELRTCCEISKRGFEDVIAILPKARSEREVEAAFWSRARIEANDVGYLTIAAAGDHACTLHWNHNHGKVSQGDLLLLDAGVEVDSLYTADITRTLPISGKFSAEQRAVYELVYEAQRAGFAEVRPGNDFLDPNRAAMRVLAQGLIDMRILKCSLEEALSPENLYYKRYTLHNVSHMLGIDVHDCAKARSETYRYGKLAAGMVLTVEPGLYFQPDDATVPEAFRGIGVRIEDDVVVTHQGHENLSGILPSAPDDVETRMKEVWNR